MSRKALIVEDEPSVAGYLATVLRRRGYEPTVFTNGAGAAEWARQEHPTLVLLDLGLPDGDGNDVCEEIKLDRRTNLIPVIMITARGADGDRTRGLRVGANAYVTKPFVVAQLDQAVQEALAWRDRLRADGACGEIRFDLQSDSRHLEELNGLLASLLHFTALAPAQIRQLTTAVREAGMNAIEWGHQKQADRTVTVTYRIEHDRVTIVVRDTGPGFDPTQLSHAAQTDDPISHLERRAEMGLREGGFGIMMARGLVDEMRYNETGNEVTLVKHCPPPCESTPAR